MLTSAVAGRTMPSTDSTNWCDWGRSAGRVRRATVRGPRQAVLRTIWSPKSSPATISAAAAGSTRRRGVTQHEGEEEEGHEDRELTQRVME